MPVVDRRRILQAGIDEDLAAGGSAAFAVAEPTAVNFSTGPVADAYERQLTECLNFINETA